jgi:hypothetical protein
MREALEPVGLFILLALATYRLARLIAIDDGPFDLLLKLRSLWGAYDYGENGTAKTSLGRGLTCPHCVGFWLAGFAAVSVYGWPELIIYWLALAGAQSFLQEMSRR